jgi:hypothetical protein
MMRVRWRSSWAIADFVLAEARKLNHEGTKNTKFITKRLLRLATHRPYSHVRWAEAHPTKNLAPRFLRIDNKYSQATFRQESKHIESYFHFLRVYLRVLRVFVVEFLLDVSGIDTAPKREITPHPTGARA